jgi:cytochrome-b5 reductase
LSANIDGSDVLRSYTPVSSDATPGHFDLLIKSYPTGNISKHVATLRVGDRMKVRGPKGAMVYTPNMVRRFGMIAGGTGITPMLQIIRAIVRGRASGDRTEVDLIFANVNKEDILLKEDLDALAKEDPRFRVYYVLNNPPEGWTGGVGFVTPEMIKVSKCPHMSMSKANELTSRDRNVFPHQPAMSRSSSVAHPP